MGLVPFISLYHPELKGSMASGEYITSNSISSSSGHTQEGETTLLSGLCVCGPHRGASSRGTHGGSLR